MSWRSSQPKRGITGTVSPENLQGSERYEKASEAADALEQAVEHLENAAEYIEAAIEV
jgi:hypothetical protein